MYHSLANACRNDMSKNAWNSDSDRIRNDCSGIQFCAGVHFVRFVCNKCGCFRSFYNRAFPYWISVYWNTLSS